ncbi:amidase domain-containing protein [Nonomuraea sp. B5E05]|uniref:amidase domain-containing protein n=1 Tax=Nonomuraea sp. B5E05 TaxID=3153569 RepID=UPI0032606EE4
MAFYSTESQASRRCDPDTALDNKASTQRFAKRNGRWELTDDVPQLPAGALPPDTYPQPVNQAPRPSVMPSDASSTKRPKTVSRPDELAPGHRSPNAARLFYDYTAMVDYAYRHVYNYNPNYRTYGGEGGDCTNFLSQIVKAGDWQETSAWPGEDRTSPKEWFYGDLAATTTYTWAAAHNWFQFARVWSGRVTGLTNVWQMGIADDLQIDSDSNGNVSHSMIVTDIGIGGDGVDELYMTYHSSDTKDKPLSSIIAAYGDGTTYYAHRT